MKISGKLLILALFLATNSLALQSSPKVTLISSDLAYFDHGTYLLFSNETVAIGTNSDKTKVI